MYEKLTFTNSTVFTASAGNQMMDNIAITRVTDIDSGPPTDKSTGVLWTKSTGDDYTFNIFQGSEEAVPYGELNKTNSLTAFYGQVVCDDSSGGPYVSSLFLDVESITAQNTWYQVGPSATGSYDLVWSALGDIPKTADWVLLRSIGIVTTSGTSASLRAILWGKSYADTTSRYFHNRISIIGGASAAVSSQQFADTNYFRVAVNSDNAFEIAMDAQQDAPTSFYNINIYLVGYGMNR